MKKETYDKASGIVDAISFFERSKSEIQGYMIKKDEDINLYTISTKIDGLANRVPPMTREVFRNRLANAINVTAKEYIKELNAIIAEKKKELEKL